MTHIFFAEYVIHGVSVLRFLDKQIKIMRINVIYHIL